MIRTENGYRHALRDLATITNHIRRKSAEVSSGEFERMTHALRSQRDRLLAVINRYDESKGRLAFHEPTDLGPLLIRLRLAAGISQGQLADRIDVSQSTISRAEEIEYRGTSVERVGRILSALNGHIHGFITHENSRS